MNWAQYRSVDTCAVLAVILVEFYKNRGGNNQEISERGRGRVSHNWKPLTKATQPLKQSKRQSIKKMYMYLIS